MIRLIVAMDIKRGIAKNGKQPWKLPADERYFSEQTKRHGGVIVMGSKTHRVIGRALPGRTNYVLTAHQQEPESDIYWINNLGSFLQSQTDVWVIGGAAVYEATIDVADELYITQIHADFNCDQFFPKINDTYQLAESRTERDGDITYEYQRFIRAVKNVAPVTD